MHAPLAKTEVRLSEESEAATAKLLSDLEDARIECERIKTPLIFCYVGYDRTSSDGETEVVTIWE